MITLVYSVVNIAFVNEIRVFKSVRECRIINGKDLATNECAPYSRLVQKGLVTVCVEAP